MSNNKNLQKARDTKNDEFYTRLSDVKEELQYYKNCFKDKVVYLNCDDFYSSFTIYFVNNFEELGLKKLIITKYDPDFGGQFYSSDGSIWKETSLKNDGDFRSQECIEFLKEADIVVTNPPFSLFRGFVDLMLKYDKDFLIIGNENAITYKNIFGYIRDKKIRLGVTYPKTFYVPDEYESKNVSIDLDGRKIAKFGNICWFTTLKSSHSIEPLQTGALYYDEAHRKEEYPFYDNYDAINVDRVSNIPMDFEGVMGVPITFIKKWNYEQFDVVGDSRYHDGSDEANDINYVNGKQKYKRILIKKK